MLAGDGIGVDVTAEATKVFQASAERFGLQLELDPLPYCADHFLDTGVALSEVVEGAVRQGFAG
ncbi:MAG: hypothetical protein AAFX50_26685, partial [Acidobacteriota bacterium]